MALALTAYVLLGGADFGGGVWDLLARGPRRARQRALIADTLAPIWEANHVWLILVVVLLFTCFPVAFARITTVLHVPLTLMLVGVVLRGSAFVFRSYDPHRDAAGRRWGRLFAIASAVTPLLLGVCLGALASGAVGAVPLDGPLAGPAGGTFADRFVRPWATPFALAVGVLALALFAFLAAVYLTVEADERRLPTLVDDFRRRAFAAAVALFAAAVGALLLAPDGPARDASVREVVTGGVRAALLQTATATCALAALGALWTRRWRTARLAAQAQAACLVWGWAWAQYPLLVPPDGTLAALAAPPVTLRLTLGVLGAGTLLLLPSFVYLFRVFRGREPEPGDDLERRPAAHPATPPR
jgi:cytochrome d ubiquinol oxidase subunit II